MNMIEPTEEEIQFLQQQDEMQQQQQAEEYELMLENIDKEIDISMKEAAYETYEALKRGQTELAQHLCPHIQITRWSDKFTPLPF